MAHRVNVVLDEEAWRVLGAVTRGQRSRFVSHALVEAGRRVRRQQALAQLRVLREELQHPPGTAEEWIRADRDAR
ncbi:MAG: hypothetical protein V1750_05675 [Acidobacteriota bacterium]